MEGITSEVSTREYVALRKDIVALHATVDAANDLATGEFGHVGDALRDLRGLVGRVGEAWKDLHSQVQNVEERLNFLHESFEEKISSQQQKISKITKTSDAIEAKLTSLGQLYQIFTSLGDLSNLITIQREESVKYVDEKFRDAVSLVTDRLGSIAEEIKDEVRMTLCDLSRQFGDNQDITDARLKDILRLCSELVKKQRSRPTWSLDRLVRLQSLREIGGSLLIPEIPKDSAINLSPEHTLATAHIEHTVQGLARSESLQGGDAFAADTSTSLPPFSYPYPGPRIKRFVYSGGTNIVERASALINTILSYASIAPLWNVVFQFLGAPFCSIGRYMNKLDSTHLFHAILMFSAISVVIIAATNNHGVNPKTQDFSKIASRRTMWEQSREFRGYSAV